jgi:hypothetical protein
MLELTFIPQSVIYEFGYRVALLKVKAIM